MLLWMPPSGHSHHHHQQHKEQQQQQHSHPIRHNYNLNTVDSGSSLNTMGAMDDDEKNFKVKRQAKAKKTKSAVLGFLLVIMGLFIFILFQLFTNSGGNNASGGDSVDLSFLPDFSGKVRARLDNAADTAAKEPPDAAAAGAAEEELPPDSIYRLKVQTQLGDYQDMSDYIGKVTLIVNTACLWGKTKVSFQQLSRLHEKYQYEGFSVLAFPTNDFHQEIEGGTSNEAIQNYIFQHFPEREFPVFAESSLKSNPVYEALQKQLPDQHVKHNFYKYLVDRKGMAVALFPKKRDPETLEPEIEALLKAQPYQE